MNEMAWSNLLIAVRDLTKSNAELTQEIKLMKMKINLLVEAEKQSKPATTKGGTK